jgi:hypothetical protein
MRLLVYAGLSLWAGVFLLTYGRYFDLYVRMMGQRLKPKSILNREMACFSDPANYTEVGQIYRRKAIRAELASIASFIILLMALEIARLGGLLARRADHDPPV